MEPHTTPSSLEEQVAGLRATVASLQTQMLDHHTKTLELIRRLVDADERAENSIGELREALKHQDENMRDRDADLAEAVALVLEDMERLEHSVGADANVTPPAPPAPKRQGILQRLRDALTS